MRVRADNVSDNTPGITNGKVYLAHPILVFGQINILAIVNDQGLELHFRNLEDNKRWTVFKGPVGV